MPELWGSTPPTANYNFDHYFAKGNAPLWNDMGNGNWATAPNYATVVLNVYNQMLTFSGLPGQCPPDGLLFGPLTAAGPCPVSLRQPGRAIATDVARRHLRGQRQRRGHRVQRRALLRLAAARRRRLVPRHRGHARRPGLRRARRATAWCYKFGSATDRRAPSGTLGMGYYPGEDVARSIAVMPDGKGYVILHRATASLLKFGSAGDRRRSAALGQPAVVGADDARSIALMPDGEGYVVLDKFGGVCKYGTRDHGRGRRRDRRRPGASTSPATS